ncbi:MAG: hypothetical protein IKE43_05835 [Coriobacteriales bacterium]|nr:hypothetical protein [Coriobacteriales bacterium]
MDSFFTILLLIIIAGAIIFYFTARNKTSSDAQSGSASKAATPADKVQIAQDIKSTQTSRVVDAVSILDEMGALQKNYRHYCELVGTSMKTGGVTAPYSHREVAYYSVRCYKVESKNGRDYETLVAQEASIEPFYFTDSSSDDRIYVDLDSFGSNIILVNSANHIEGPNSDFSQAFKQNSTSSGSYRSTAYAAVANIVQKGANVIAGLRSTCASARRGFIAFAGGTGSSHGFAYATNTGLNMGSSIVAPVIRNNYYFAAPGGRPNPGSSRGGSMHRSPSQMRTGGPSRTPSRPTSSGKVNYNTSLGGPSSLIGLPRDLGDFLDSFGGIPSFGGGYTRSSSSGTDLGGMILGMGLGALLNSLGDSGSSSSTYYAPQQQDTFRGYRIIEDIVPMASPIYCIGELYKSGERICMGRSLAADYPTSYFATKPEAELLSALGR